MRCFPAQERGACVGGGPWAGGVLSLHSRALNILRADGLVVSVVADRSFSERHGSPCAELFDTALDPDLIGVPAVMEDAVLRIGTLAAIDCARGQAWEGAVDSATRRSFSPLWQKPSARVFFSTEIRRVSWVCSRQREMSSLSTRAPRWTAAGRKTWSVAAPA